MSNANNKYALINVGIIFYFLIFNPFYATTLTAITNLAIKNINKVIFCFSFCLSWSLYYFLKGVTKHGGDAIGYLEMYYNSRNKSIIDTFYKFLEVQFK